MTKTIEIPESAVVVLIGPAGSGKSTFARKHFRATQILSSDFFRGLACDDEGDQSATSDAFDSLYLILGQRLARGRLTVVDATNVRAVDRARLLAHVGKYGRPAVAIVFNTSEKTCMERSSQRADRVVGEQIVRDQFADLQRNLTNLASEGFVAVFSIVPEEKVSVFPLKALH